MGLAERDDAAVVSVRGSLVQSVDLLPAMLDDPWLLGQVAAQHALNDLYALHTLPQTAQAVLTLSRATSGTGA